MDPKLSIREWHFLQKLAEGFTYKQLGAHFGIRPEAVHVTCYTIRRKTGIRQTRDPEECARTLSQLEPPALKTFAPSPEHPRPRPSGPLTWSQLEAFRLLAMGRTYQQIAAFLGITPQSAQNLISRGCKRAGIVHQRWNRTRMIREWLKHGHSSEPDPMDDPAF